jgi:hypothetical protein
VATRVDLGRFRLELRPGALKKAGEIILRALDRQAQAGLGPAKKGGQITLHSPNVERLWKDVEVQEDGSIDFRSTLSFLLAQYGADDLQPEFMAQVERELEPLLNEAFELKEG